MYQLFPTAEFGAPKVIKRIADNASIPFDPDNSDYAEYLRWLSEGNTPTPAEEQGA